MNIIGIVFRNAAAKKAMSDEQAKMIRAEMHPKCVSAFATLDKMLEGKKFVCGDNITIADFQLYAECRNDAYISIESQLLLHTNVVAWKKRCMEVASIKDMHDDESKWFT